MINLPIKFEVPNYTRYGNMKGVAKCRKWDGLGWLGVTQCHWEQGHREFAFGNSRDYVFRKISARIPGNFAP